MNDQLIKGDVCCPPNEPSSQYRPLVANSEVVNDGLEILSVLLGPIGGLIQRLAADSLTTDIVSNLLRRK